MEMFAAAKQFYNKRTPRIYWWKWRGAYVASDDKTERVEGRVVGWHFDDIDPLDQASPDHCIFWYLTLIFKIFLVNNYPILYEIWNWIFCLLQPKQSSPT